MKPHPLGRHDAPILLLSRAIAVLMGLCLPAYASEYYVDYSTGSDSNAGTSTSQPWLHAPGDPVATAVVASATLAPGDVLHFKGGVTYVFTGRSGISLNWSGAANRPITYDGNSSGNWGVGRASFTDHHGDSALAAFSAVSNVSYLSFANLDVRDIGGAATLPTDSGSPAAPRSGAGFVFKGTATGITIDSCTFHQLGYTFGQKPMSADSIAGTGISVSGGNAIAITNCTFSEMAIGVELTGASPLANLTIANCTFAGAIVWTIAAPPSVALNEASIYACTEDTDDRFDSAAWGGYGSSPRVTSQTATAGAAVSFVALAAGTPGPTFQWLKDGNPIAGATSPAFGIPAASSADAGVYRVVATNSAGVTVSNDAVLTVASPTTPPPSTGSPPMIATQPANVAVAPLGTATFSVIASGSPTLSYQWRRNGTPIAGWTNPTLSLVGVSSNDVGSYSVVVTNSLGSVTSDAVTLSVSSSATPPPSQNGAPTITTQPANVAVAPLGTATFSVIAAGSPTLTYQWRRNGTAIAGWTNPTLSLVGISSNDVGSYSVVVTNSLGSVTSDTVTLSVDSSAKPPSSQNGTPTITTQPANVAVAPLGTATFSVIAAGSPTLTYQWRRNGTAIAGWTNATLSLVGISSNDVGSYSVVVTNSLGSATSDAVTLSLGASAPTTSAPTIATQPVGQTVATFGTATFFAKATGNPTPTYQWQRNGVPIAGWTNPALVLVGVTANDVGTYTVVATNPLGTALSEGATLAVVSGTCTASAAPSHGTVTTALSTTADASRLMNLSVRSRVDTANGNPLIVGFVVSGEEPRTLLIRGIGPTLGDFGVAGAMPDPVLSVHSGSERIAMNDDWSSSPSAAAVAAAGSRTGAFALAEPGFDAALLATFTPGVYTVQADAFVDTSDGVALIELYDASPVGASRLVNLSVRTYVSEDNSPIIGFVVSGPVARRVLVRAIGPGLAPYGVRQRLDNPRLELNGAAASAVHNDNWNGTAELIAAFATVGAFPLDDPASLDAALIFSAAPGPHTVTVTGTDHSTGTVLVEVYELP